MRSVSEQAATWLIVAFLVAVLAAMSLIPETQDGDRTMPRTGDAPVILPAQVPPERLDRHGFEDPPRDEGGIPPVEGMEGAMQQPSPGPPAVVSRAASLRQPARAFAEL